MLTLKQILNPLNLIMKYKIIIFLFVVSIDAYAQYGDAYHAPNNYLIEKQQRQYTQNTIDRIKDNMNSKSTTNGSANYNNDLKNWLDGLKETNKTPVRVLSAEEIEMNKQRAIKNKIAKEKIDKENAKNDAIINARNELWKSLVAPDIAILVEAGFAQRDADFTGYKHIWDRNTFSKTEQADNIMRLTSVIKYVKNNVNTISFEELQPRLNLLYFYAPSTTFNIINNVRIRFPDKSMEFDNMTMNTIENYFFSNYIISDADEIVNTYFNLIKKYPQMAHSFMMFLNAGNGIYHDPYTIKYNAVKYNPTEIDKKEKRNYMRERLMAITGMTKYDANWYKPKKMKQILNDTKLKFSDIVFLCDNITHLRPEYNNAYSSQKLVLKHDGSFTTSNPFHSFSGWLETFEALATEGNEDAIKMYAISTCNGSDSEYRKKNAKKDKMFANINKWAGSGDFVATIMMFKVLIWEQYESDALHLNTDKNCDNAIAIAKRNEKLFTKDQLMKMGEILQNINVKHNWRYGDNGKVTDPVLLKIKNYGDELLTNNKK